MSTAPLRIWIKPFGSSQKVTVAYNNRCLGYSDQKNYDRAIAECDQAIRLDPNLTVAYNNRCLARLAKGDLDGALRDCDWGAARIIETPG